VSGVLPTIQGDQRLIKGLFENLLDNALKYRKGTPHIEVSAEQRGQLWLCQVVDNGVGVPEEEGHEVFLMFARGSQSGSVPGVGIGLALCRKIVEYHGGRIWLDSGKGEGTTVSFTLPVDA
jgi:signal transduction histidine kinase